MKTTLFILSFLCFQSLWAGVVKGTVKDKNGSALPFTSVYVKNTSYGTTTNFKGEYFLELEKGDYTLVYSFIGYKTLEKKITIATKITVLNVNLDNDIALLADVEIVAKTKDRAKSIMKKVRANRTLYLNAVEQYTCKTYLKASLEKEPIIKNKADSLSEIYTSEDKKEERLKKEKINLIETISKTYYKNPNKYKEIIEASHDYATVKNPINNLVSFGINIGEEDISAEEGEPKNPYLIYTGISDADFNFYKNKISFSAVSSKYFISPLASTSSLSYTYDYKGTIVEDGKKIFQIEVIPRFKNEALFYGSIYIEDSSWALKSLDLNFNEIPLANFNSLKLIQNYKNIDGSSAYLPYRRELYYNINNGSENIIGNTRVSHTEYDLSPITEKKIFNTEIKKYNVDAFDKKELYWTEKRPLILKESEIKLINEYDSLTNLYSSPNYLKKIDSAFNRIRIWNFLLSGIGHKNSFKGTEFRFTGLINQIVPFGVGGYRHRLGGYFNKEFKNNFLLETDGQLDYGFSNKDWKGKVGVGLTYVPLKFVRTFIRFGDYYELINQNASYSSVLSRSNYARTQKVSIAQRMEIFNGLYAEATFSFQNQIPIDNLKLADYSFLAFGNKKGKEDIASLNSPKTFNPYKKAELNLSLKYRFKQKYYIKNNKKIITEAKYPTLALKYRRGFPKILDSEVDFEYIELSVSDYMKIPSFGYSKWKVSTGTFTNKNNLRILEHKYFRGSDNLLFSNPANAFQLLGYQFDTRNEFFQANYMHHFEGAILNKIPIVSLLKLELATGVGTLLIKDQNFAHFEAFGGLERITKFKLWGDVLPLRIGCYMVTADNNLDKTAFRFKIGFDVYDSNRKKWNY